jgi:hypothetical protein
MPSDSEAPLQRASAGMRPSFLLAGLLCIGLYVALAAPHISTPGLEYDESLFVNAALGKTGQDLSIYARWHGIPVMVMPYIGALKSFVYYPIFKLFGVSYLSIRLPCILLSAVTLWLWFRLIGRITSDRWAVLFVLLLAANPGFVNETRADHGPVVLMLLAQAAALTLLLRLTQKAGLVALGAFLGVLFLGIYDKLNFLWFILALAPGTAIFAPQLWRGFRTRRISALLMIAAAGILLGVLVIHLVLPILSLNKTSYPPLPASWAGRLSRTLSVCDGAFSGQTFLGSRFPVICTASLLAASILMSLSAMVRAFTRSPWRDRQADLWALSLTALSCAVFLQMSCTVQAAGSHHAMMLLPLVIASLVVNIAALYRWACNRFGARPGFRVSAGAFTVGAVAIGLLQLHTTVGILQLMRSEENLTPTWSTRITALTEYVDAASAQYDTVLCADWGIGMQLYAFSRSRETRDKIADVWPPFTIPISPELQNAVDQHFLRGKRALLITHGPQCVLLPPSRDHMLEMVSKLPVRMRLLKEIPGARGGRTLFEVYEVLPSPAADPETPR